MSKKKAAKRSRAGMAATSSKSAMAEASLDLRNVVNLAMSFGLMASDLVIARSSCSCAGLEFWVCLSCSFVELLGLWVLIFFFF